MPTSVDERVVSMKFDNKSFEQNAEVSLKTLDTLKQKLDFSGIKQSLGQIDTSSLKKAFENIGNIDTSKLNSALDTIQYRMSTLGTFMGQIVSNIADDLYGIVKNAMAQIDKVINFAEEGIVTGGYNRAFNIQTAKFQLEGLGIAWEEIADDINFAVKDTAYSLDQAAIVASRLSTSGIRPGETWTDYSGQIRDEDTMAMILRSISGTASATGGRADYAQIGNILTKMISYGKVNLQQLNELGTFGIGAKGIIAEYMNKIGYQGSTSWEESDISDITASRTSDLDPMLVIEALYDKFGEHAVKANETLTGVIANTKSALARIGANFWEPLLENSGPLVGIMEVVRQSLNDLNSAIGPVVNAFAVDLAGVLDKIKGLFMGKEYIYDEDGNLVYDEMGNPMTKWSLKKKGGIFSSFFEPWTTEKTWVDDSEHVPTNLPADAMVGHWEEAESRAVRIANNIRDTLNNLIEVGQTVFKTIGAAIKEVFPNAEGLAGLLVRITEWMKNVTEAWKNSSLFDSEHGWEKSNFYRIVRGLAAAVDIVIHFGKSFKEHIIDPIFNNSSVSTSGIGDAIAGVMDAIWEFDERLKNGEDVFGPFLEGIKDGLIQLKEWITTFIDWVSPYLKDFFGSIVNWWKPVKDILFDTDISWSDKWGAIKDYFAENFELPGWSKVKTIFEGIGSAISFVVDKVRDFFGWNEKSDTLSTDPAASPLMHGGMATGGGYGKLDMVKTIQAIDVNSEKLPTIGERLKSFGESLASIFGNFNPGQFKTAAYAVLGALAILVLGVIFLMYKGYTALKEVGTKFPVLFGGVIKELQKTVGAMGKMFKAQSFEAYAAGFKNLAAAIALLSITIVSIGVMIAVMEAVGDEEKIKSGLWAAFGIVSTMTIIFGAISLVFVKFSQKAASMGLIISKAGLDLQMPIDTLGSLRGILVTLIGGVVVITGLIVVLGLMMSNEKAREVMKDGAKVFLQILVAFVGSVLAIAGVVKLLSLGKISGPNFAKALAGMAGIMAALGTALMVIAGSIIVLGLIPVSVLKRGGITMGAIFVALAVFVGGIMFFAGKAAEAGKENLKATTVGTTLLGLAAVIFTVALAMDSIVISMILLDKLNVDMTKGIVAMAAIAAGIVVISVTLMKITSNFQTMKGGKSFNAKTLLGIAAMIASIGAAFVLISISAAVLDRVSIKGLIATFAGFLAFAGGMALIISQMKKMNEGELKYAGKLIAVIAATVISFTVMGAILSRFVNANMAISYGIIGGTMLALLGFVWGIGVLANKYKGLTPKQIERFGTLISDSVVALIPVYGSLGIFMLLAGAFNLSPQQILSISLGLMGAIIAVVFMLEQIGTLNGKITTAKQVERLGDLLFSASMTVLALGAGMSAMFIGLGSVGLSGWDALAVSGAFGIAVFATAKLLASVVTTASGAKPSEVKNAISLLITGVSMMSILGIALAAMFVAVGAAGLNGLDAMGIGIGFGIAVLAVSAAMTLIATKFQNIQVTGKMVAAIALAIIGVVAPIAAIAFAVAMLVNSIQKSGISTGKLAATIALLIAMVAVPAALIILGGAFKGLDDDQLKNIAYFSGVLIGVALALGMVANALTKLAKEDSGQMARAALILGLMAAVVTVITAVLAKVNAIGNIRQALTNLATFAGVCASLYIVGGALKKVAAIEFKNMKESLIAMGVVVGLAVAIAAILGTFHTVGTGALKAGALLLGMGVMLAGLGVFMVLFAEGMNTFMDMILELNGKSDQISGGLSSFLTGFAEGLLESFKKFNEMLPQFLEEISKFIDSLFGWINDNLGKWFNTIRDTIKIALIGISDIVNDPDIQDAAVGIVSGILDFLIKGADTWVPKILELAGIIAENLWKGIFGTPIPKDWVDVTGFLVNVGEVIDEFFGGHIQAATTTLTDMNYDIDFADSLDKWRTDIRNEIRELALEMGYAQKDVDQILSTGIGANLPDLVIGYATGREDVVKWVNELGGIQTALMQGIETEAKKLGITVYVPVEVEPEVIKAQANVSMTAVGVLNDLASALENSPERQRVLDLLREFGSEWSSALNDGERNQCYEEMLHTLWSMYQGCNDPIAKAAILKTYNSLAGKSIEELDKGFGGKGNSKTPAQLTEMYRKGQLSLQSFIAGMQQQTGMSLADAYQIAVSIDSSMNRATPMFTVSGTGSANAYIDGMLKRFEGTWFYPYLKQILGTGWNTQVSEPTKQELTDDANETVDTYGKAIEKYSEEHLNNMHITAHVGANATVSFESIVAEGFDGGVSQGILQASSAELRDTIENFLLSKFGYGSGTAYYFVPIGQYVTAGITAGMTNGTSKSYISTASISLKNLFVDGIKSVKAFDIRSPAHDEEIRYAGSMITAGLATGAEEGGQPYINDAAAGIANGFGSSLTNAMEDVDLTSIGTTLKNNITAKIPSWDSMKSNFGWEKGLSGNLQGVKNVWNQLKSSFMGEDGGFDINTLFGGLSDKLKGGLSGLFSGFDMNSMGMDFDMSSMLSFGADSVTDGIDFSNWQDEFSTFDASNLDNTVELNIEVNDMKWNQWKDDNTGIMVDAIPTMGGFQRSTVGSTYVNNYNYNQTNNSPTALNTREINRQTELLINRNRSRWAK